MPISAEFIGRRLPGQVFIIDQDAVALFSQAVQQPVCTSDHDAHVVPVTFPITALMGQMSDALREAGVNWDRVVHGDQKFTYARPLHIGDQITGVTTVESSKVVAGNEIISVLTEFSNAEGELVVSCWSTLVERGEK